MGNLSPVGTICNKHERELNGIHSCRDLHVDV
jgi:hypothetical protein